MRSASDVDELVAKMKSQGKSKTEIVVAAAEVNGMSTRLMNGGD